MPEEISVVRMLNELVRTPLHSLDKAVTRSIGRLAEVSGAGWACLFRMEDGHLRKRYSYMAPGLQPVDCDQDLLVQPYLADLVANRPAYVPDRTALPDDHPLKPILPCGALLALPIFEDERLTGVLAFVYPTARTDFGPLQIDRMKARRRFWKPCWPGARRNGNTLIQPGGWKRRWPPCPTFCSK